MIFYEVFGVCCDGNFESNIELVLCVVRKSIDISYLKCSKVCRIVGS